MVNKLFRIAQRAITFKQKTETWAECADRVGRRLRQRYLGRREIGREELKQLKDVIKSGRLFNGPKGEQFSREFARQYGVRHAIPCTSGTAAIHVALGMLNLNPRDEVITTPITDLGTVIPILYQNARPVFADIDAERWSLAEQSIEKAITPRTKAIIVVHLLGAPADMDGIREVAKRHNLVVIEDCAQAHMARYKGQLVGTLGDIGCFSFQQSKQMTTGEGGMTITNCDDYAARGRLFIDKGWDRAAPEGTYDYVQQGTNYRMSELQAAVGIAQLRKVVGIAQRRNRNGRLLAELLADVPGITTQRVDSDDTHTYWHFGFTVDRDAPFTAEALTRQLYTTGVPGLSPVTLPYGRRPVFLCCGPLMERHFTACYSS